MDNEDTDLTCPICNKDLSYLTVESFQIYHYRPVLGEQHLVKSFCGLKHMRDWLFNAEDLSKLV